MADIAKEHDLFLISDEVYREIVYGGEAPSSMLEFTDAAENVAVVDSISKRFSATGARVGVLISRNQELMAQAMKLCQGRLCAATLDQVAAAALYRKMDAGVLRRRAGGVPPPEGRRGGGAESGARRAVQRAGGGLLPDGDAAGG